MSSPSGMDEAIPLRSRAGLFFTNRDRAAVGQRGAGTEFEVTEHVQRTSCVVNRQRAGTGHRQVAECAGLTDVQDTCGAVHCDTTGSTAGNCLD